MSDTGELQLSDRSFERVRTRLYEAAGISLSDAKRTLVVARLGKLVRGHGSFDAYLDHLGRGATAGEVQDFVNALTTNLTRFFREDHHFSHLVSHVGALIKARRDTGSKRLRIWSAGCSTGQEPFSAAVALLAAWPELRHWDLRILATDIDTGVLATAVTGTYPDSELNGLGPAQARLFERMPDGRIRIPAAAASLVSFKPLNLMAEWPFRGPMDAIFCRNVAIYFDRDTQTALFERLGRMLAPGGYLYIGHSEHMGAGVGGFRLVGKTIYQARAAGERNAA